ncbi:hypothetical protein D3C72_1390630 [compost metagenome]
MLPVVRVPVLSITMRLARVSTSSTWPRRSSMPLRVRWAVAEVSAVGVASDRAQGQVATSTDRVTQKARSGAWKCQKVQTAAAMSSSTRMKWRESTSASWAMAGLSSSA